MGGANYRGFEILRDGATFVIRRYGSLIERCNTYYEAVSSIDAMLRPTPTPAPQ